MAMEKKRSGKERAIRIPLDYYKTLDPIQAKRLRLRLIAILVSLLFIGGSVAWSMVGKGKQVYSRGHVAAVHAAWDANCEACHDYLQPQSSENWINVLKGSHAGDAKCIGCHDGPTHHKIIHDVEGTCASCHQDHQGKDFSLIRSPDRDCTSCHANLTACIKSGGKPEKDWANVTSFPSGHPDFRSITKDPGKLKFTHAQHMSPGQNVGWKLANIKDETEQARYASAMGTTDDTQLVKLDCTSCHKSDTGDLLKSRPNATASVPRTTGAYMMPVTFDNNCKACHLNDFDPTDPKVEVPHGLQPAALRPFIEGYYVRKVDNGKALDLPVRRIPGKSEDSTQIKIRDLADKASKILFAKGSDAKGVKCSMCHIAQSEKDGLFESIAPTQVPLVWLTHGGFNHAAHRAIDCKGCHEKAYPVDPAVRVPNSDERNNHETVNIPNKDNCQACHAPASFTGSHGGVRHDCVECHRYHDGDGAFAKYKGLGTRDRDIKTPMTVGQFLSGLTPKSEATPKTDAK